MQADIGKVADIEELFEETVERFGRVDILVNNAGGRLGEPGDVADVIQFLVSEESRWVTWQTIRINGGLT